VQSLENKVVWITGGGSGMGASGARILAEGGAIVVLSGRRLDALQGVADEITAKGGRATVAALDVLDAEAVKALADKIIADHGQLDILINSAGINVPNRQMDQVDTAAWDAVIGIDLNGAFYCCNAVLPQMRKQGDGLIINVSSWAGVYLSKLTGPAYAAAKTALNVLNENINMAEGINGIRACALCPGEANTEIIDKRPVPVSPEDRAKMLQADDLGETINFIARMPANVCLNQITISPTWNRSYIGGI